MATLGLAICPTASIIPWQHHFKHQAAVATKPVVATKPHEVPYGALIRPDFTLNLSLY
jgi:hypothetical protein